jgi:hypothetical protein
VRGRNNSDHTLWFWIVSLQRKAANEFLFEEIDEQSVHIKLRGKFIRTQHRKTSPCMNNLWLLNKNDCEQNKPDPKYKGAGTTQIVAAEHNFTPPMIF